MSSVLKFRGCAHFRQRVVCATLTGRAIYVCDIRKDDDAPGLRDFEASFLRLVEKMTNGCSIEVNETGTGFKYRPGILVGGRSQHDCGTSRAMGWFIEGILPLCPFAKNPVDVTFTGITNDDVDLGVDTLRSVTLPLLKHFGLPDLTLKIKKRGAPPQGGGEVQFGCPIVRELNPINLTDPGLVRRIRGVAYSTRVSPQISNRMVDSARNLLNKFIPDVYVYSDHYKGDESGRSPGFGVSLVAETTTGCMLASEATATPGVLPEDLGSRSSKLLCQEIQSGGCVDGPSQSLMFLCMVLTPEDVSKVRIGALHPDAIQCLRHLKDFFGVMFKLVPDYKTKTVVASCLGIGYKNLAKSVT
jgi:RNA 3'-terminal phosphate cyclase-like protein